MRWLALALAAAPLLAVAACSTCTQTSDGRTPGQRGRTTYGGSRPATLVLPPDHDPRRPTALLVLLHGYGSSAADLADYLGVHQLAARQRFLVIAPDGTPDSVGHRFWNATDVCCNFDRRAVDDVAYLTGLVRDIGADHALDRRHIHVLGHSNGGFMAYRLACSPATPFSAIVSIAGAMPLDARLCKPTAPVRVLQIHGDGDRVVLYAGGDNLLDRGGPTYPGAEASVQRWAAHNACKGARQAARLIDLDASLDGAETAVSSFAECPPGGDVQLWAIRRGTHVPAFSPESLRLVWEWLAK
jgi:polyhydroxybutyrate depolymerase